MKGHLKVIFICIRQKMFGLEIPMQLHAPKYLDLEIPSDFMYLDWHIFTRSRTEILKRWLIFCLAKSDHAGYEHCWNSTNSPRLFLVLIATIQLKYHQLQRHQIWMRPKEQILCDLRCFYWNVVGNATWNKKKHVSSWQYRVDGTKKINNWLDMAFFGASQV